MKMLIQEKNRRENMGLVQKTQRLRIKMFLNFYFLMKKKVQKEIMPFINEKERDQDLKLHFLLKDDFHTIINVLESKVQIQNIKIRNEEFLATNTCLFA